MNYSWRKIIENLLIESPTTFRCGRVVRYSKSFFKKDHTTIDLEIFTHPSFQHTMIQNQVYSLE